MFNTFKNSCYSFYLSSLSHILDWPYHLEQVVLSDDSICFKRQISFFSDFMTVLILIYYLLKETPMISHNRLQKENCGTSLITKLVRTELRQQKPKWDRHGSLPWPTRRTSFTKGLKKYRPEVSQRCSNSSLPQRLTRDWLPATHRACPPS